MFGNWSFLQLKITIRKLNKGLSEACLILGFHENPTRGRKPLEQKHCDSQRACGGKEPLTGAGDREVCFPIKRKRFEFPSSAKLTLPSSRFSGRGMAGLCPLPFASLDNSRSQQPDPKRARLSSHTKGLSAGSDREQLSESSRMRLTPATGPLKGGWSFRVERSIVHAPPARPPPPPAGPSFQHKEMVGEGNPAS